MSMKVLLRSSLFVLAFGHNRCTMAEHNGACTKCGDCPFKNSNFGCKVYGDIHHAGTNSVKKCLSQDASCGGPHERCYGTIYQCEPGYLRPDGSSEYSVSCQNGALDYGPACVRHNNCDTFDTTTATVVGGPSVIGENANAMYECLPGWIDAVGPPPVTSTTVTCIRNAATPNSASGVLSPNPASICAIKPGCTDASMSNFDAEATMDDGSCVECFNDSHCTSPSRAVCNTVAGTCVQCRHQSDCSSDASQTCDMTSNTCQCAQGHTGTPGMGGSCVRCFNNSHCTDISKPVCNVAAAVCVQCKHQSDCASDASQMCDMTSNTCQCAQGYTGTPGMGGSCVRCLNDSHCTDINKPVCNVAAAVCVQCKHQSDCASDASQMCDMASNTCQCAPGHTGTPGPSGVCSPPRECSVYDTEVMCSSDNGCAWIYEECMDSESSANREITDDALSMAIVTGLVGILLCCLLLCLLCCCAKRKNASDEDSASQLPTKDGASSIELDSGSTTHKSSRSGGRIGTRRRRI